MEILRLECDSLSSGKKSETAAASSSEKKRAAAVAGRWLLSSFHALLSPVESINSCVIPASRLCLLLLLLAFSTY